MGLVASKTQIKSKTIIVSPARYSNTRGVSVNAFGQSKTTEKTFGMAEVG